MNPKRYFFCTTLALAAFAFAGIASATPAANSAVVVTRIFNDCPSSTLTVVDNDFASILIDDAVLIASDSPTGTPGASRPTTRLPRSS